MKGIYKSYTLPLSIILIIETYEKYALFFEKYIYIYIFGCVVPYIYTSHNLNSWYPPL